MNDLHLLEELIAIPGPPGQERRVHEALTAHVERLGYRCESDAKGNLLVTVGEEPTSVVVTAHMDEIAMIVRRVEADGCLSVAPLGGLFPWKIGEGPVLVLAAEDFEGVLSFGSIHTDDPTSTVRRAEKEGLTWDMASVFTGRSSAELNDLGVRPGTRVVVSPSRRKLTQMGDFVAGYFLDDRADLVSWLLALEVLAGSGVDVLFAATTAEEVGGEGAKFILQEVRPDVCIALELGPLVGDAPIALTAEPTVWTTDGYSNMLASDGDLLAQISVDLGMDVQFQSLSRGGSDASASAAIGLCGRPITLGLPMQNSHGFEIMHRHAMVQLANLTAELVKRLNA